MSLLSHPLGFFFLNFISGCFAFFSTQLKTQLEQNEMLVEKEQLLRQKLALELEEVGAGEKDTSLYGFLPTNEAQELI